MLYEDTAKYALEGFDGKEIPKGPPVGTPLFECPSCGARHTYGTTMNGADLFRCHDCGYVGHGFHTDRAIDRKVYVEHCAANEWSRAHGIPEVPLGVDPLNGPG